MDYVTTAFSNRATSEKGRQELLVNNQTIKRRSRKLKPNGKELRDDYRGSQRSECRESMHSDNKHYISFTYPPNLCTKPAAVGLPAGWLRLRSFHRIQPFVSLLEPSIFSFSHLAREHRSSGSFPKLPISTLSMPRMEQRFWMHASALKGLGGIFSISSFSKRMRKSLTLLHCSSS